MRTAKCLVQNFECCGGLRGFVPALVFHANQRSKYKVNLLEALSPCDARQALGQLARALFGALRIRHFQPPLGSSIARADLDQLFRQTRCTQRLGVGCVQSVL